MNKKLIVVADLGLYRAYEVVEPESHETWKPRVKLVDEHRPGEANEKISEQVTDQQGRFAKGGGAGGVVSGDLSSGERNDLRHELDRRAMTSTAERIDALLADDGVFTCWLAASAPIHKQLVEALKPASREKLGRVLASNLASTPPNELLSHFEKVSA